MAKKPKSIITSRQLDNLKPTDKPYDVAIGNIDGLFVRVGKRSKSFKWDRGRGEKPRIITYGQFPQLSLKDVRVLHDKAQQEHKAGTYGVSVANDVNTIGELSEYFYKKYILVNRTRPDAVRQILDRDIIPTAGKIKLSAINVRVVRAIVEPVAKRTKEHGRKVLAITKQMFDFAVKEELMPYNPASPFKPKDFGIMSTERTRVLDDSEIAVFWKALDDRGNDAIISTVALKLLLLLGIRTSELMLASWDDVNIENKTLTIPAINQKGDKKHKATAPDFIVPLDSLAGGLLLSIKADSDYVFYGKSGDKPTTDRVLGRTVRRMLERLGYDADGRFTPHDLRRTLRTRLSKITQPHIAEKCLNHSLGKISNIYDQDDYLDERREALSKWSDYLQRVVGITESNVVELRAA